MIIKQISVFLENRPGKVCEFSRVLKEAGVNIENMFVADTSEFGLLRAITDDNAKAIDALRKNGFNAVESELAGFVVDDKPGEMYNALKLLEDNGLNIEYLYSFAQSKDKRTVILLKTNDVMQAERLLGKE